MLEVIDLGFDYPDKGFGDHAIPLLHGVCFTLSAGSLLHLRGKNGSGKTTLLKLLAGLLHPESGDIRYSYDDKKISIAKQRAVYQEQLCYVGHKTGISQALTVFENCRLDLQRDGYINDIDGLLRRFSLLELKDIPCYLLSAGQRRRVGLLRLMLSNAPIWLLDEPLVALDSDSIDLLMVCMKEHTRLGGLVIVTSHQRLPLHLDTYQEYCL